MSIAGALAGIVTGSSNPLSDLVNMKATKSNVVQRFVMAENGQNLPGSAVQGYAAATAIVDQTYSHAYLENIPDKSDWVAIYQQLLQVANPTLRAYMNAKSGAGKTGTGSGDTGSAQVAMNVTPTATGGVSLLWLGVILLAAGAGVWFFLKKRR
jgi:hypothetical protein